MWQEAWKLVAHDLRRAWANYLLVMVTALACGAWTAVLLGSLFSREFVLDPYLIDFYFLAVIPVIGCPWYTGKYTERTFQQLRFYRNLPISIRGVVLSRMLLVILRAIPNAMFLFGTMYALSPELQGVLSPIEFLWFALIWFGYGIAMSCWYPYWETKTKSVGKMFLYSIWYVVLFLSLGLLFWMVFDLKALELVLDFAQSSGWLYALLSNLFGLLCAWFLAKLAKRNLERGLS
jgi:hypothetical protein